MTSPEFITFTGVDAGTDILELQRLASDYPCEFGILFSPSRCGQEPRYPTTREIDEIIEQVWRQDVQLAAHLCGDTARSFAACHLPAGEMSRLARFFNRIQVNTREQDREQRPGAIADFGNCIGKPVILQCRGPRFPDAEPGGVQPQWLFDTSGGRGKAPAAWPPCPSDGVLRGYAGGINSANVRAVLRAIGAGAPAGARFWIDMESGVRDADDRFDLGLCRAVCQAVYGLIPHHYGGTA